MNSPLLGQIEQFPIPIPFQEAIESLHEAGLAIGIGLDDVLHVGADEDQAAGMAERFPSGPSARPEA